MAEQLPGNGRFRGSQDDKFEFWALLTRLGDLLAAADQVGAPLRDSLAGVIKTDRQLLDTKRIPLLTRKRWLRQLRREVERIEQSGLDDTSATSLYEMLSQIQARAGTYRDL
jgi:hypothetical protein